jgi:DNA-binding HxlR family transcriptional regulator
MKLQVPDQRLPKPKVEVENCPVQASLGVLGHKWSLLVLRNIELYGKHRFNEMLRVTPGLTKRVLSMRLKELESESFIEIAESGRNYTRWELTQKGKDVLPILLALVQFGSKWYADQVFADKEPRALQEIFDDSYIRKIMRNFTAEPTISTYPRLSAAR